MTLARATPSAGGESPAAPPPAAPASARALWLWAAANRAWRRQFDVDHVVANYDHGMGELSLPLAEAAKPRRIAIGTGSDKRIERAA